MTVDHMAAFAPKSISFPGDAVARQNAVSRAAFPSRNPNPHSVLSRAYQAVKQGVRACDTYSRLHDRHTFDDRSKGSRVLVCMLAGYKPDLWPFVMPRFRAALTGGDVCLVSPGRHDVALAQLCRNEGWSYLSTGTNDVSLAQNVCFRLHPGAEMIVKVDEDMFLLPDTIAMLLGEYRAIRAEGIVDPGIVAPLIPLNGFCYRHLLEMLGLLDEYEALFGRARLATAGVAVQNDAQAARWIWERTAPLAATAERLGGLNRRHLICPIQFSIGIIAFERRFWEEIGAFAVHRRRLLARLSTLGGDEAYLCTRALELSRPVVVTTRTLAGHFSFGPQYAGVRALLDERPELFAS